MLAKFAGQCAVCRRPFPAGAQLRRTPDGWAHPECSAAAAVARRNRERINAGETFAGTPAPYRRKPARRSSPQA